MLVELKVDLVMDNCLATKTQTCATISANKPDGNLMVDK